VGLAVALLLHAAIVATTLFSWQHHLDIADETPPVVPVDLVTVAARTNIAPTVERMLKPKPADDVKPPQLQTPVPTPTPPPPQTETAPDQAPTPKPVELKPAPAAKPVPETAAKPAKPDKKKPTTDDFSALLNKLTAPATAPRNAHVADRTVKGVGAMNASTMDLIDALRNAITPCWNPPVGAPHPERLVVTFELFLNPDGSVAQPPQLSSDSASAAAGDPFVRAAAEAARRAIYTCAPYKLPGDKYGTWRDITIDFDPRKMVQ
jgi:outer membrane biosynthesis protein TonB